MKKARAVLTALITVGAAALLISCGSGAAEGAGEGLDVCMGAAGTVFPFMALAGVASKCAVPPGGRAAKLFSAVFALPAAAAPAMVLSLVGGYPVGAFTAAELVREGALTREQGERLACFCFVPSPAFAVNAVGRVLLGAPKAGAVIYFSCVGAALLTGTALARLKGADRKPPAGALSKGENVSLPDAVTGGVRNAGRSFLTVCAWIILFAAAGGIASSLGLNGRALAVFGCLTEITGGTASAAGILPFPALAAFTSFGGLCTQLQAMSAGAGMNIRYGRFLLCRLFCAAVTFCAALTVRLETQSFAAGAAAGEAVLFSAGAPAAVSLLVLSVIFILDRK